MISPGAGTSADRGFLPQPVDLVRRPAELGQHPDGIGALRRGGRADRAGGAAELDRHAEQPEAVQLLDHPPLGDLRVLDHLVDRPDQAHRHAQREQLERVLPAELGGAGSDILTTVLVMEALGYGCQDNGLIFSLNAQMWSLELPLVKFGTPAQQHAYLPGLMSGDLIGVHAMTEPESGSDAFSMRTRVERVGEIPAQVR